MYITVNRSALKGIFIGLTLLALTQITACYAIVTYAVMTFTKAGKSVDPNISMIVLGVALCLGSITSAYLADKLGRRKLNLISLMGCTCGLLATALYHYLGLIGFDLSAFAWIPVICLSITIFIGSAGIIPLASICCVEYLPPKVRQKWNVNLFGLNFNVLHRIKSIWIDSNIRNGIDVWHLLDFRFYFIEDLSTSFGSVRFTRLFINLCSWLHYWIYICTSSLRRNQRNVTWWCGQAKMW